MTQKHFFIFFSLVVAMLSLANVRVSATRSCRLIVEDDGVLVIDGGTLSNADIEMKPGATLQLINNGIIETRNGFEVPRGAIVDIIYGQIL